MKVASSIREYGFRQPIVVDAHDVIIIGHLRLAAAKQLGLKEVPVHVAGELSPAQVKGLRLMDNRSHEESDWDLALLAPEIADLRALAFDLSLTGFDGRDIDSLLATPLDDEKANATPPLPEIAASRPGDLWLLGPHRVLCGECHQPGSGVEASGRAQAVSDGDRSALRDSVGFRMEGPRWAEWLRSRRGQLHEAPDGGPHGDHD